MSIRRPHANHLLKLQTSPTPALWWIAHSVLSNQITGHRPVATRGCGPSCSFDNGSGRRERLFRTAQAPVECTRYGRSGRRHAGDGELPAPCCGIAYLTHRCQRSYASGSAVLGERPNAEDGCRQELVADTPLQVTGNHAKQEEVPSVVEVLEGATKRAIAAVQDYSQLSFRALTNLATPPHYFQDTLVQMDDVGVGSVPIILLSGFFIGGVMVLQTGAQFVRFGQTSLTGDVVSLAMVRELAPAIPALLTAGRCSSGMASELGSMLVTEQVDAMRAMGTDPSRKLVTPRVVATILRLPLLAAMSDFVGLLGGFVVASFELRLSPVQYWTRAIQALEFSDLMQGLSKPIFFGFILSTVGCYKGLTVSGGPQGVARATHGRAVVSSVFIIVANFFLTRVMLYLARRGL